MMTRQNVYIYNETKDCRCKLALVINCFGHFAENQIHVGKKGWCIL